MSPTTNDTIDINGTDDSSGNTDTNSINPGIIGPTLGTCVMILIVVVSLLIVCTRRKRQLRKNR